MGYYHRGDYYRGDYYRGDPFLGGLVGGLISKAAPLIGKGISWLTKGKLLGSGGGMEAAKTLGKAAAGAATAVTVYKAAQPVMEQLPTVPMFGGGEPQGGGVVMEQSRDGRRIRKRWSVRKQKYVAIRNMNPLNPKALNRAIRRATRFERYAKTVVNCLHTGPRKFKAKGRKK